MNSTPRSEDAIMVLTALPPPPPIPITLIQAPRVSFPTSSIISNLLNPTGRMPNLHMGNFDLHQLLEPPDHAFSDAMEQMRVLRQPGQMVARSGAVARQTDHRRVGRCR